MVREVARTGVSRAPDLTDLVRRVRAQEPDSVECLYTLLGGGIRFYLRRYLEPQDLDDKVHDVFLLVIGAIQRGEIREPERLMGYIRTVVRRQVAGFVSAAVQDRNELVSLELGRAVADTHRSPEENAIERERIEVMKKLLQDLPPRDQEVLTRFYVQRQAAERISSEMHLTKTQFRLLKCRAKARFEEMVQATLARRHLPSGLRSLPLSAGRPISQSR